MAELGPFRILVDGNCPVCRREGNLLRRLDDGRKRVIVEDISRPDFNPTRYGLTQDEVMREIHGITWDGRIVKGMEVFRTVYDLLGLGFLTAPTGWPILRPIADVAYKLFARNRHLLAGWGTGCESGSCRPR